MKLPIFRAIKFLAIAFQYDSTRTYEWLRRRLLILKYPKENIDCICKETKDRVSSFSFKNVPFVNIIEKEEIAEWYNHQMLGIYDQDIKHAMFILGNNILRRAVELLTALRMPVADIAEWIRVSYKNQITERSIHLYCKYFWDTEIPTLDLFSFLQDNDPFDHLRVLQSSQNISRQEALFTGKSPATHEFSFIAETTYDLLVKALTSDSPDPKVCAEWLKMFTISRDRATNIESTKCKQESDDSEDYSLSVLPENELGIPLRDITDFITIKQEK